MNNHNRSSNSNNRRQGGSRRLLLMRDRHHRKTVREYAAMGDKAKGLIWDYCIVCGEKASVYNWEEMPIWQVPLSDKFSYNYLFDVFCLSVGLDEESEMRRPWNFEVFQFPFCPDCEQRLVDLADAIEQAGELLVDKWFLQKMIESENRYIKEKLYQKHDHKHIRFRDAVLGEHFKGHHIYETTGVPRREDMAPQPPAALQEEQENAIVPDNQAAIFQVNQDPVPVDNLLDENLFLMEEEMDEIVEDEGDYKLFPLAPAEDERSAQNIQQIPSTSSSSLLEPKYEVTPPDQEEEFVEYASDNEMEEGESMGDGERVQEVVYDTQAPRIISTRSTSHREIQETERINPGHSAHEIEETEMMMNHFNDERFRQWRHHIDLFQDSQDYEENLYTRVSPIMDPISGNIFYRTLLFVKLEEEEAYQCSTCAERLPFVDQRLSKNPLHFRVYNHFIKEHSDRYHCRICPEVIGSQFRHDHEVETHMKRAHNIKCYLDAHVENPSAQRMMRHVGKSKRPEIHVKKGFNCYFCGTSVKVPGTKEYNKHLMTHMNDEQKKSFRKILAQGRANQKANVDLGVPVQLAAPTAQKKTIGVTKAREQAVSQQRKFFCSSCGQKFLRKFQLNDHSRTCRKAKFKCTYRQCSRAFSLKKGLQEHVQQEHIADISSSLVCQICGKVYASETRFTKHKLQHHHGLIKKIHKSYNCQECGRVFPLKRTLKKHIAKVHDNSNWRIVKCEEDGCDAVFPIQTRAAHIRSEHNTCLRKLEAARISGEQFEKRITRLSSKMMSAQ